MEIRLLQPEDFAKGFLETLSNLSDVGAPNQRKFEAIWRELFFNPCYRVFVAEANGQIVGTITLLIEQKFIHAGGKVGHIEDVAVRKGWERKGIGRALVKRAVEEARKRGCYKVILNSSEENIPFYKKCGFQECGTEMRMNI